MRLFLIPAILIAVVSPAGAAQNAAETRYQSLVADAKAGKTVDWQAMRFAYADRPGFKAVDADLDTVRREMYAARKADNFPDLLAKANQIIAQDYADGEAHLMAGTALTVLGQKDLADRERAIAVGLLKSIMTGDGLSAASAFTVISVHEEYELINARQRRSKGQSLKNEGGHAYDVIETVGKDGDTIAFYFLIDRVLAAEAAEFKNGK
jgi:hypothetical protein